MVGPTVAEPLTADATRLTRDDWLDAAFAAVADSHFGDVRVLTLAQALGVTRGSFYWHFADHAALIQALLERWKQQQFALAQGLAQRSTPDALSDLEVLLEAALATAGADLKNTRFELALRALGRTDTAVAHLLAEVDECRMALFQNGFARLTGDENKAADLAALFYLTIVGSHHALCRPLAPETLKDYLAQLISTYVIRPHQID